MASVIGARAACKHLVKQLIGRAKRPVMGIPYAGARAGAFIIEFFYYRGPALADALKHSS